MAFKIRSEVLVQDGKGVDHVILSREKLLHEGQKISVKGSINRDEEAKGLWISAKGEIRIIDERTLGIRWRPTFGEALFYGALEAEPLGIRSRISEAREYGGWDEEYFKSATESGAPVELRDAWHLVELSEVFTLADRTRTGPLTEEMLKKVERPIGIYRKTEVVYEK